MGEMPVWGGDASDEARLGKRLEGLGRDGTVVSGMGPAGKNPLSADKAARDAAVAYMKWVIDCTAALGAKIIVGPMHSEIGHFSGDGATAGERKRALAFHRKSGDYAAKKDVRFALEALNRLECYFLNTMAQLAD